MHLNNNAPSDRLRTMTHPRTCPQDHAAVTNEANRGKGLAEATAASSSLLPPPTSPVSSLPKSPTRRNDQGTLIKEKVKIHHFKLDQQAIGREVLHYTKLMSIVCVQGAPALKILIQKWLTNTKSSAQ